MFSVFASGFCLSKLVSSDFSTVEVFAVASPAPISRGAESRVAGDGSLFVTSISSNIDFSGADGTGLSKETSAFASVK